MTEPKEQAEEFWSGWMVLVSFMAIAVGTMVAMAHGPRGEPVISGIIVGGVMIVIGLICLAIQLIDWLWKEYL